MHLSVEKQRHNENNKYCINIVQTCCTGNLNYYNSTHHLMITVSWTMSK